MSKGHGNTFTVKQISRHIGVSVASLRQYLRLLAIRPVRVSEQEFKTTKGRRVAHVFYYHARQMEEIAREVNRHRKN